MKPIIILSLALLGTLVPDLCTNIGAIILLITGWIIFIQSESQRLREFRL